MFVVAQKIKKSLKVIAVIVTLLCIPQFVSAANLSFSQPKNLYSVGETFSVSVYVDSPGQSVNAVSGTVSFPKDVLSVVSVSKSGSVISLWVQEPSFSNAGGTVNFEGVILNPGFTGNKGKVVTITFKAKDSGTANLGFSSGSVLANDGSGSNILQSLKNVSLTVGPKTTSVEQVETDQDEDEEVAAKVSSITIVSQTHPDQKKWYSNNTPEFSWKLPVGALEVRTSIGKTQNSTPSVRYLPAISYKKVEPLPDGKYYFAMQVRTYSGWSAISRYRVNIDTTPPEAFSITFPHGNTGLEPQPVILFNTTDTISSVQYYDIKIGSGGPARSAPLALSNPYPLPPQDPGNHIVTVTAIDEAGNITSTSTNFTIEGIDAPIITYYPEELDVGDVLKVRGTTYPNADVYVSIKEKGDIVSEEHARSNMLGDFSVVATKQFRAGAYGVTARVVDSRGAKSRDTVPVHVKVHSRFLVDMTESVLNFLSVCILGLLALTGIVTLIMFMWHRFHKTLRRIQGKTDISSPAGVTETSFVVLKKDIQDHVSVLRDIKRKKPSIKEEIVFLENFEADLAKAEEIIERKIKGKIEKN